MDGRALNQTAWYDYICMAFKVDYQGDTTTDNCSTSTG